MRRLMIMLAFAMPPLAAGGCAHTGSAVTDPNVVAAYRQVRTGHANHAEAAGYFICADRGGVEVYQTRGGRSTAWTDKIRDSWIRGAVHEAVTRDRALDDAQIATGLHGGEAQLRGRVSSDAEAMRAVGDALEVSGVVAVNARLDSPESVAAVDPQATC